MTVKTVILCAVAYFAGRYAGALALQLLAGNQTTTTGAA